MDLPQQQPKYKTQTPPNNNNNNNNTNTNTPSPLSNTVDGNSPTPGHGRVKVQEMTEQIQLTQLTIDESTGHFLQELMTEISTKKHQHNLAGSYYKKMNLLVSFPQLL